nr:carcinoembryonic antigen-related cell adhesion molecule 16-like [Aotus nancymaae]
MKNCLAKNADASLPSVIVLFASFPPLAFFLNLCRKQVSAQLTITSDPPRAIEGGNVTLSVQGIPQNLISYNWLQGATTSQVTRILNFNFFSHGYTPGPAHAGRETGSADGSLTIIDARALDDGIYTLHLISSGENSSHRAMLLVSGTLGKQGEALW